MFIMFIKVLFKIMLDNWNMFEEQWAEFFFIVVMESECFIWLINQVFDFEKIQLQLEDLKFELFDLVEVAWQVFNGLW